MGDGGVVGDGVSVGDGVLYVYAWAMGRGRWWYRGRWCAVFVRVGDGAWAMVGSWAMVYCNY